MVAVNVTALMTLTKLWLPDMIARRSGIVLNVASVASFMPGPRTAVYYATKAFVLSFSEALSEELRDTGVVVSALCPGLTATEFQARAGIRPSPLAARLMMSAADVAEAGVRGALAGRRVVLPGAGEPDAAVGGPPAAAARGRRVVASRRRSGLTTRRAAPSRVLQSRRGVPVPR